MCRFVHENRHLKPIESSYRSSIVVSLAPLLESNRTRLQLERPSRSWSPVDRFGARVPLGPAAQLENCSRYSNDSGGGNSLVVRRTTARFVRPGPTRDSNYPVVHRPVELALPNVQSHARETWAHGRTRYLFSDRHFLAPRPNASTPGVRGVRWTLHCPPLRDHSSRATPVPARVGRLTRGTATDCRVGIRERRLPSVPTREANLSAGFGHVAVARSRAHEPCL